MPVIPRPLNDSKFTLDASGIAGFFGGEEAISAMATVHLFQGRKWLGWYNSPGSYTIAKRFGQIASSRLWDGFFSGPNETPAVKLELDGRVGPKYVAFPSRIEVQTGHFGYLTMKKARDMKHPERIAGRETVPSTVAFLELKDVKHKGNVPQRPIENALLAFIPISISFVACGLCALVADWYSFSMIALSIISNGLACLVIGSAELVLDAVQQFTPDGPSGDGILIGDDMVIVVKGAEKDVNAITKGKFALKIDGKPTYDRLASCSLLLLVQVLLQVLLLPQGSLFGRIMFVGSLGVSWVYNSYLFLLLENAQTKVLFKKLGKPKMRKFCLGTKTTMALFIYLLLCDGMAAPYSEINLGNFLREFIPQDTQVWQRWRNKVTQQMSEIGLSPGSLTYLEVNEDDRAYLGESGVSLLTTLLNDAKSAFAGYHKHFRSS